VCFAITQISHFTTKNKNKTPQKMSTKLFTAILMIFLLNGTTANWFDDAFASTKGAFSTVGTFFENTYNGAADLFSNGISLGVRECLFFTNYYCTLFVQDLKTKVNNTVEYLKNAYENRQKIVDQVGQGANEQLDKMRPAYEEAVRMQNKVI
jgi:hypothetical protein